MNATDQVFPSGVVPWAAVMIWGICLAMWGTGLWILVDVGPNIKPGNALMYFPEANVLVDRAVDPSSRTPAFKGALITLEATTPSVKDASYTLLC
jgi:hypothetical protein